MNTNLNNKNSIIANAYQQKREDLFKIFRQVGISETECEDMIQDVFIKIMNIDLLREDTICGLAVTMAYHLRTDWLRRRAIIVNKVKPQISEIYNDYICTNNSTEVNELAAIEMKVVGGMSELDSKTYTLSRFEEKTTDEIAQILNISNRAVESRLYRTRKLVREKISRAIGF